MIRIEIITNIELLDEFLQKLEEQFPHRYYSILPVLKGYGKRGYAFGDTVWPENNVFCIMFCEDDSDLTSIKNMCDEIQNSAPQNAIKIFASKSEGLL